jgi:hypothetical protein
VIDELTRRGWIQEPVAKDFKNELSGRTSTVHTNASSKLSLEGTLAAVAVLFVPLGAALLNNKFGSHHRAAQWSGVGLLLGPLLVVLGFVLAKFLGVALKGRSMARGTWQRTLADLHPMGFFAKDQTTDTTTIGIQRGEPTSVEFERLFDDVLRVSLNDSRQLLIVLDNLDRVDEADARTVIATMQTFTGTNRREGRDVPNVWTLIPYDPVGLDRLWATASDDDDRPSVAERVSEGAAAAAFVEKLFEVRFETPPLVLSDWRGYLLRLLSAAFPGAAAEELLGVVRLRALYVGAESNGLVAQEAPTPRQLKQYVNQIGAVRRQRSDVALNHVAYYALLRRDRIDVSRRLIDNAVPHPSLAHLFSASIRDDLAALQFGTSQELAQQLLLGGALDTALARADVDTVERLSLTPGFSDALDSLDLGGRAGGGGVELTRAVSVLSRAGVLGIAELQGWPEAVLLPLAQEVVSWTLVGTDTGIGVAVLADLCVADGLDLSTVLARIESAGQEADEDRRLQVEGFAGAADELLRRGHAQDAVRLRIDLSSDRLVSSLAHYQEKVENPKSLACLEVSEPPSAVAMALVEAAAVEDPRTRATVRSALSMLLVRPERLDLPGMADSATAWLRGNDPAGPQQLSAMLELLDVARRQLDAEEILGPVADDGTLMHMVSFANTNAWYPEAAAALLLHLVARPSFPEPAVAREAAAGSQLVRGMLADPSSAPELTKAAHAWLASHKDEGLALLFALTKEATFRPWVEHQERELFAVNALDVSAKQFAANWKYFQTVLGDEPFVQLSTGLLGRARSRKEILKADDIELAQFVRGLEPESENEDLRDWARRLVRAAPSSEWEAALGSVDGGSLLQLAVGVGAESAESVDPTGLVDALHAHFRALATGAEAWRPEPDEFGVLVSLLRPEARHVLASQLCAELEGLDSAVGPHLFPVYGATLANESTFRTHQKLPNIVERLIAHDDWNSVGWAAELAAANPDTLAAEGRSEEIQHLTHRVRERLEELGDDAPDELTRLAEQLGLEAPGPPENDGGE